MKTQLFYIKERHNPQIGIYYVAMGQLSKAAAKRSENSIYGQNVMLPFGTEKEYRSRIGALLKEGHRVSDMNCARPIWEVAAPLEEQP